MCPTTSQNPSRWHLSWLNRECTTRKNPESVIHQKQPGNYHDHHETFKPRFEPRGRAALLGSFPFSRGSSQPWDRAQVSHIAGRFFTS